MKRFLDWKNEHSAENRNRIETTYYVRQIIYEKIHLRSDETKEYQIWIMLAVSWAIFHDASCGVGSTWVASGIAILVSVSTIEWKMQLNHLEKWQIILPFMARRTRVSEPFLIRTKRTEWKKIIKYQQYLILTVTCDSIRR